MPRTHLDDPQRRDERWSMIDMTAVDFARFGYLFLRGGERVGIQIVPEAWVDFARIPVPDAFAPLVGWSCPDSTCSPSTSDAPLASAA